MKRRKKRARKLKWNIVTVKKSVTIEGIKIKKGDRILVKGIAWAKERRI